MSHPPLRVWHIPQVPGKPFHVTVGSVHEGVRVMHTLAEYDNFQYENNIKGDFASAQGLEEYVLDSECDGEWLTWYSEDGEDDPEQWVEDNPL